MPGSRHDDPETSAAEGRRSGGDRCVGRLARRLRIFDRPAATGSDRGHDAHHQRLGAGHEPGRSGVAYPEDGFPPEPDPRPRPSIEEALLLGWEAEFRTDQQRTASELIGEAADPPTAKALVEQFAAIAACDLTGLVPGAEGSGGLVEIRDADAAGIVFIESPELDGARLELGAAAVGSIVVVFTIDGLLDAPGAETRMIDVISLAVAKLR